jgi:hypothetical protein
MNPVSCTQEAAVLRAVCAGEMPQTLASHAAGCAVCREIVETSHWMQSLARGTAQSVALPDAKLVWWQARLADRQAKAERTKGWLEWLEIAPGAIVPLGLAGWVAWHWYSIQAEAMKLLLSLAPQFVVTAYSFAMLAPVSLLFAAMFLMYPLLVKD